MIVASIEREFSVWQRMGARECPVSFFRASETLDIHIFLDWFFGRRGGRRREGCSKGNRSVRQRTSARECSVSRVSLFLANETLNVHFWTGFSENVRREIVHFFEMIVGREFSVRQRTSAGGNVRFPRVSHGTVFVAHAIKRRKQFNQSRVAARS